MLDRHEPSDAISHRNETGDLPILTLTHPDDVLNDAKLSVEDKRAMLAAWASDAHAVPNVPALRQLPSGDIVHVDTVLAALSALDEAGAAARPKTPLRPSWARPRLPFRVDWRRARRRDIDDDDDPPPCPAAALPPRWQRELPGSMGDVCRLSAA